MSTDVHNVINGFSRKVSLQRSSWLTSCALRILESHTRDPRALFVSLIILDVIYPINILRILFPINTLRILFEVVMIW